MKQLQKYKYEAHKPLAEPYNKDGIYNAYFRGFDSENQRQVLISEFSDQKFERVTSKLKRIQKLKEIRHENVTQIYDTILDKQKKRLFVVMEWCVGGNLYDYEKSNSTLDCDLAVKILLQLMEGLREVHKADQIHRHINMENVEFDQKGKPKLSFRCLYPKMYYMSPEDIQGTRNKQNDIFSLGVLFYKMLLGQIPFKGNSSQQQKKAIEQGPKFPKDDQKIFPLSLPIQIKNLIISMTLPKGPDRWSDDKIIQQCKKYLKKMCKASLDEPNLSNSLMKKIFKENFVPIFVRKTTSEQHIIIALYPAKNQFNKFHIYKSKSKQSLDEYVNKILRPYRQVKDDMQIVPIYDNFILDDEYLVVRTFYDNQGSLKFFLDHSGTIQQQHAKAFIEKLLAKLKKHGRVHNHLTNENILIKGGNFYINYPPFLTKQYINQLKGSKNEIDFLAPQIKDGKQSKSADAWSVAMLKYMLQNQEMPKFDKNGRVIIPNWASRPKDDVLFFQNALVKDEKIRKNLDQIEKLPQQISDLQEKQKKKRQKRQKQAQLQAEERKRLQDLDNQLRILDNKKGLESQKNKLKNQRDKVIVQEFVKKIPNSKQPKKTFGQLVFQRLRFLHPLQKHWTKPIRVGIKCLLGIILLIFLYYWQFFLINGQLITEHSLYEAKSIEIRGFNSDSYPQIYYNLVTKTPIDTYKKFYNNTLSVLRDDYKCVLNDYSVQSDVVAVINDSSFTAYQVFGILFAIINLIIFCISLSKMDFPKIFFISKIEQNNFNEIWNWMFINLALATQISFIYLLYGSLFHMELEPCLSKATLTAVQFLLKKWNFSFNIRFIWIYLGLVFSYAVVIFFIIKPQYQVNRILKAVLIALYLAGTFSRIMGGSGGHVAWQKESVFGKVGELLLLILSVIYIIIDMIFGCCVKTEYAASMTDNKINRVNDDSNVEINPTQQEFLPE